jgi:hypothetical protein
MDAEEEEIIAPFFSVEVSVQALNHKSAILTGYSWFS